MITSTASPHPGNHSLVARYTPQAARRLVWLTGLSHAVNHYVMLIFPAVLLLVQREYGLGFAALGLLANLGLFAYGAGALPAGILADRWGAPRMLAVWLLGGSFACACVAIARGPVSLALGFALLGLFASLHHPAGSGVLALLRNVPGQEVGRAFGVSGLLGNMGLAASPILSAAIGAQWGWRIAFWIGVLPGLLLGPALWRLPAPPSAASPPAGGEKVETDSPTRKTLTFPLLLLFAFETLMGFIFQGFTTFFPTYLATYGEIPGLTVTHVTRGGSLASVALLFGGLGHLLAGRLMGTRYRTHCFAASMLIAILCLFGMAAFAGPSLVVVSIAMTISFFTLGTMSNTFIAAQVPARWASTAFGITFTLAFTVGSMAASTMGVLAERAGLPHVFTSLGSIAVLALVIVLWFSRVTAQGHSLRS